MIRNLIILLLLGFVTFNLKAQNPNGNYNPYVNQGIISPSPLWPVEAEGKGMVSFNFGNTGDDDLDIFPDQLITLTITLSGGEPDHIDPVSAVSGSSADLFTWSYNAGTYTALQVSTVPAKSSGTIDIAYSVTENSTSPGSNGFNVNITPAPYQTSSNSQNDDAVSSYTYTEIRDYGDAPASYGAVYHSLDDANMLGALIDGETSHQSSPSADGDDNNGVDDEDGVSFPATITQGESISIPVTVKGLGRLNAWIDWNGDGDFEDADERVADNILRIEGTESLSVEVPEAAYVSAPIYARFRLSSATLSSSSGAASGGEVEDYSISVLSSSQAPSVPTGLVANSITASSVGISWNASTDNVGVTGYNVYRDGVLLGTTAGLIYTDNTVSDGNIYVYTVSAYNAAGFESAQSSGLTVTIDDVTAPSVPTGLNISSTTMSSVSLYWSASTDNVGVTGYRVYRDGVSIGIGGGLSYTDNTVVAGNSYTYSVSAYDVAGNESLQSAGVTANPDDTEPPTVPEGLQITSVGSNSISIAWEASTDNVAVSGYRVYRSGILMETTSGLFYTDNAVVTGTSYTYTIAAFDAAGNASAQSEGVTSSTTDVSPPSPPEGLHAISVSETSVSLSWEASLDNVGVTSYSIYRNGGLIGTSTELNFVDNAVSGNPCIYTVTAWDAADNESAPSDELVIDFDDEEAPTVPTGLQVTSVTVNSISLLWNESSDNVMVTGYLLYRNGDFLQWVTGITYTDNTVVAGKSYTYSVSAIDARFNESEQSRQIAISVFDNTPPSVPAGLLAGSVTASSVSLSWDVSLDDVGVAGYNVYRLGSLIETVDEPACVDLTVEPGVEYTYTVSAFDAAGNESEQSDPLSLVATFVNDAEKTKDFIIYPNPSQGSFVIDLGEESGRFQLELISSSGAIVDQSMLDLKGTAVTYDCSDLRDGLYYLRIFNSESCYYGKLLIGR